MTEVRKPPACHYDRQLHQRVTREHRDDCPSQDETPPPEDMKCPAAGHGCKPCTAPHCLVCGRNHATNATPDTCPECEGGIKDDLADIQASYTALHIEALDAGHDGQLVAAAPIPGGVAAVLIGPTVRLDLLRISRITSETHRRTDPLPPLAVLAQWEDMYRAWFAHTPAGRASVAGAIRYLSDQLPHIANPAPGHPEGGPDFLVFARQVRTLRAHLERALHDEREPEVGVECFECGDRLVRRFRDPKRCRHTTPAREKLRRELIRSAAGRNQLRVLLSYPELGDPTRGDLVAGWAPAANLLTQARKPCKRCAKVGAGSQGGLDDPRAGRSWECPGCRKEYTPGEYATAMRRDLLENGDQGDGWTHLRMASDAASTLVGLLVPESTVRKWLDRGKVAGLCEWTPGRPWGQRLVYWPDVAAESVEAVARAQAADDERRRRLVQDVAWRRAVVKGADPRLAAKRLGISKARLEKLLDTVAA